MNVLVYAISRDDARAPAAPELQEICAAGLRALAEPVEEPLAADLEHLVHYEETVEAVMQSHTILPMRFGSVVDGEDGVRALLKSRAREFASALSHLDGAVEFGLQASLKIDPADLACDGTPVGGPGRSYMRARLEEQQIRRELQAWLDAAVEGLVRERVYRVSPVCGPASLGAAYLIDREAEDEFVIRLAELADSADHTLSWSGPWPPYSFAEGLDA
jgi:hypothetical protein